MDDTALFFIVAAIVGLLLLIGILEKRHNERNLRQLKLRINVNGIRGKSTITRMITAILQEAGYHVVGKTTGTAARMFYWDQEEEEEVKRRPKGVSIGEQIRVINKAVKRGADALVCECMAVRPDYQTAYQHQILKGGIVVIVNVLEDHLDEMGPTLEQLAWAFADTIPYEGVAVVSDNEFVPYFQKIADERKSRLIVVDPNSISEDYLRKFDYTVFSNNCAVPLGVAKALGIDEETALRAMLKARPDPGALRVTELRNDNLHTWFINAFAANEPTSTMDIWETIHTGEYPLDDAIFVMNCRPDRVDRTVQFARDLFPKLENVHLVVIGEQTHPIKKAYQKGKLKNLKSYNNLENASIEQIMATLTPMLDGHVVIGVGNIHGIGGDFINALAALDSNGVVIEGAAPL